MKSKPLKFRDFREMDKTLKALGFKQVEPGFFHHTLTDRTYDFTACSPEGAIKIVHNEAIDMGVQQVKNMMRSFLGI